MQALKLIAHAPEGGVLVHCGAGRDRTGIITLLLLALADVAPSAVADDYALSAPAVSAHAKSWGRPDEGPIIDAVLAARGTTVRTAVIDVATELDVPALLRAAGLRDDEAGILRSRLRSA